MRLATVGHPAGSEYPAGGAVRGRGRAAADVPVRVRGLTVAFPRRAQPAILGLDLEVDPGERVVLRGPSGGGKSTLLHVLTGVVPQSVRASVAGSVSVLGRDPRREPVPRLALDVGWLGQDPTTNACLPVVEDEVALPLENRGVPREQIGPRVRAALAAVGAGHLARHRVSRLSGGEQQRVALAAALVGDPALLLLDEPTAMLDPVGAAQVLEVLGRDAPGRTVLLVEHRPDRLPWVPDTIVVIGPVGPEARAGAGPRPPLRRQRSGVVGAARLTLRGAAFARGGRDVVRGVHLQLRAGQVTAVVGANGSGKSSLLLGCAGLIRGDVPASAGDVALAFQRPEHQFVARTAAAEVGPGGLALLARFGLAEHVDSDPFRLSGGQQRRLALAAMLALDRGVLLADEPTAGLDPAQASGVERLLVGVADSGRAVALATHDLELARRVADQVVVLAAGECVAVGGPELLADAGLLAAAGLLVERAPAAR